MRYDGFRNRGNAYSTAPGAVLRVGQWIAEDGGYGEALADVETFEPAPASRQASSADSGWPMLVRSGRRMARRVLGGVRGLVWLYVLAQAFAY